MGKVGHFGDAPTADRPSVLRGQCGRVGVVVEVGVDGGFQFDLMIKSFEAIIIIVIAGAVVVNRGGGGHGRPN